MRKTFIAVLAVGFLVSVGVGMLHSAAEVPDGLPDIAGSWTGKVRVKDWDLTGNKDHYKARERIEVDVLQEGYMVQFTIHTVDGGDIVMEGVVGDGRFWAYGETGAGPLVMVGKIRNKGRRVIANLLGGDAASALEVKVQMKKDKVQVQ